MIGHSGLEVCPESGYRLSERAPDKEIYDAAEQMILEVAVGAMTIEVIEAWFKGRIRRL